MTTRSDLPRLAGSLSVLGTVLEANGQLTFDRTSGWEHGPRKAPATGERGGGGGEAGEEDRKDENAQRNAASKRHRAYRSRLDDLDRLVQEVLRDIDIACPPNPEDVKNRRTGDLDPWTSAEVAAAGWCSSCWRHEQTFTPAYIDRKGQKRWKDSCSWCGPVRSAHKVDPPIELLAKHLAGRNISVAEFEEAITKAKQAGQPKAKGKKKAKRKAKQAA